MSKSLQLHVFPSEEGSFNLSPFCTKVEILLKLAGVPYRLSVPEDYRHFSKGKLPVLGDGEQIIEDSEFIRWHLQESHQASFSHGLSARDRALGLALCRMAENHSYLALVYARWVEEAGWTRTRALFFSGMPDADANQIRTAMRYTFDSSALAAHDHDDIKALLDADLHTFSAALADTPFFFADQPSFVDASLFGLLVNLYAAPEQTWCRDLVGAHGNLVAYVARGLARWYPTACTEAA